MIADLKPYPAMKDSGVPWLGKVPEHWSVERLRVLMSNVIQQAVERWTGDLYVALEHVESWTGRLRRGASDASFDSQVKRFRSGDVLFGKLRPYLAKVTRPHSDGVCVGEFLVLRPRVPGASASYVAQMLRSKPIIDAIDSSTFGAKMPRADWQSMGAMPTALPPAPEQAAIVRFLEYADRRIRRYIRAKQKLFKLLEEQKQVIVHRAVTRGLDSNVRLKPSGVQWLDGVPEHWDVVQVRRVVASVTSGSRAWSAFYSEQGDVFLQSGNLGRAMALDLSYIQRVLPPPGSEGERTRVRRDDVLVCITGALTGNVAQVDRELLDPAFVNQHVALVRPNQAKVRPRFLAFALHSEVGRVQFKAGEYGGTKQGLGLADVKSALIPLPPMSEQMAICTELDSGIAALAMAISRAGCQIALLREYRTRLIADVVTGKLDVREAAARLPDEPAEAEAIDEGAALTEVEDTPTDGLYAIPGEIEA